MEADRRGETFERILNYINNERKYLKGVDTLEFYSVGNLATIAMVLSAVVTFDCEKPDGFEELVKHALHGGVDDAEDCRDFYKAVKICWEILEARSEHERELFERHFNTFPASNMIEHDDFDFRQDDDESSICSEDSAECKSEA